MDYCWPCLRDVTALGAAMLAASIAVGCSNETGVLVEVTRDSPTTPADIETLEFVIGLTSDVDHPDTFLLDSSSISEVSVVGRDLASSPFHLLVKQGGPADARLTVAVLARKGTDVVGFGGFDAPQAFISGQVLLRRITLANDPNFSLTASGCVIWFDAGENRHQIASLTDQDCDGDLSEVDCDDHNGEIGPSRTEVCGNQVDDNCKLGIDEETDDDQDLVTNCKGDCDDNDPDVHEGATEVCDGKDNNCNGQCDDGPELDFDMDRFNLCGERIRTTDGSCVDIGVPDCDDKDAEVNPDATETCNGKDDDCKDGCDVADGVIDLDGDGVSDCGSIPGDVCVGGRQELLADCQDMDPDVHPGAAEVCDGKDDNCDTIREQHEGCYSNETGTCRLGTRNCDDDGSDGTSGVGEFPCMTTDGSPAVSNGLCSAYAACEAMQPQPADLFACANAAQSTTNNKLKCTLFFKPDLSLCPELRAALPVGPVAGCRWAVLGGLTQAHYQVGLFDGSGTPQASIATCDGAFGIVDSLDLFPRQDSVYLQYSDDGTGPQAVEVRISPMLTAQCPQAGLQCTLVPPN